MASEEFDDGAVSFAVPADVGDWLDEEADRRGETRGEFCRSLLSAVSAASSDDEVDPIDREDLEEVRSKLEAQRTEFVDHVEDVRDRVVQVKREADSKAAADHEHAEYATESDVRALREAVDALEASTAAGFENFETILEEVLDDRDALASRSEALARAVLDLRDERDELLARERRREAVDRLREAANRLEIERATCSNCAESVTIALLTRPACPHCGAAVGDVERRPHFLGSHRLVAGEPPALEGRTETETDDLEATLESIPGVDGDTAGNREEPAAETDGTE